jgi:endoglucanase
MMAASRMTVTLLGLTVLGCGNANDYGPNEEVGTVQQAADCALPYRGVNLAGAEFGDDKLPGTFGVDYTYPDPAYGYHSADYFLGKGMNTFRLGFKWERLQPTRLEPLNATELNRLRITTKNLTAKGAHVILNPHNYARYYDLIVGTSALPNTHFADFWGRLASEFKDDERIFFGLVNEPHDMPTEQWLGASNAAIAAIRESGAKNLILVPGNQWTGAWSWTDDFYGTANSVVMLNTVDPGNNYAFEVHQYLDAVSGGFEPSCVSATIGVERMQKFTAWLEQHGLRGFLGEFGGGANTTCAAALRAMLTHVEQNANVYLGWTWWAAGPWWGDYFLSIEPYDNGGDRPNMNLLEEYLDVDCVPQPPNPGTGGSSSTGGAGAGGGTTAPPTGGAGGSGTSNPPTSSGGSSEQPPPGGATNGDATYEEYGGQSAGCGCRTANERARPSGWACFWLAIVGVGRARARAKKVARR